MDCVAAAVAALRAGELAVLPTDTVYGLCALPEEEAAVSRIFALKRRPDASAIALVAADVEALCGRVPELRGRSEAIVRTLLPGPYTLVLPNPARRYAWLNGTNPEAIGVRVPALAGDAARAFRELGAVAATSANLHGEPDPRRLEDVAGEIRRGCGALLDGGELPGTPSTVLDLTGSEPRVIREGAAPAAAAIERVGAILSRSRARG